MVNGGGKKDKQEVQRMNKEEMRKAMKRLLGGKAEGPDGTSAEAWNCLVEVPVTWLTKLYHRKARECWKSWEKGPSSQF